MLSRAGALIVALILAVLGGAGYWFMTVYDTAEARCSGSDPEACPAMPAREAQERAQFSGAQQAPSPLLQLVAQLSSGACLLRVDGYNAAAYWTGPAATRSCAAFAEAKVGGHSWSQVGGTGAFYVDLPIECEGYSGMERVTVYDTGVAVIGAEACTWLGLQDGLKWNSRATPDALAWAAAAR